MSDKLITGRVGGRFTGYDLNLLSDGERLFGRIGGSVVGDDVDLTVQGDEVRGSGPRRGWLRRLRRARQPHPPERHRAPGRRRHWAGRERHHRRTKSFGQVRGRDLFTLEAHTLRGRIGGSVEGKDVSLTFDAPVELAVLAAVIAYKSLEDDNNAAAASAAGT